jgi:multicomponent Na+:H+ antiporter subunit F
MMFIAAMVGIMVTMSLALARAMLGRTVFDQVLALNMFGTKTVLLISVAGFLAGRPDFLDLGLVYALMNFIGVMAVLKFLRYSSFAETGDDAGEDE